MRHTVTLDLRLVGLLLAGALLGAAPFLLQGEANAASDGPWRCYVSDRLHEPAKAAQWKVIPNITKGLNEVAAHVPAGTIISIGVPVGNLMGTTSGGVDAVCVK